MTDAVDARADLDDRYGRAPRSRRRARDGWGGDDARPSAGSEGERARRWGWMRWGAVVAALTIVVVGFWALTQAQQGATSTLSTNVVNFRVPDDARIEADIAITVQPGTALACALEATNAQHLVVGWNVIDVPPSDANTTMLTTEVRTTQRAETVVVKSCWIP